MFLTLFVVYSFPIFKKLTLFTPLSSDDLSEDEQTLQSYTRYLQ